MKSKYRYFSIVSLVILILAGCSENANNASSSIENYIQALIAKDNNALINHSCAAWEADAKNELNSFDAVSITVEDLTCQESGQDGEYTVVACSGKIIANYGNEVLELNLADQKYLAIYEGGEWRMCGYR